MCKASKPCGFLYWEYILFYVDDILVISHSLKDVLDIIAQHVTLKPDSVHPPISYLGADISRYTILDVDCDTPMKQVWTMSAQEYIR